MELCHAMPCHVAYIETIEWCLQLKYIGARQDGCTEYIFAPDELPMRMAYLAGVNIPYSDGA